MDDETRLSQALCETLLNIAGVSDAAAKQLRPEQALVADLGLEEVDLDILAAGQRRLGDRLRLDGGTTRIDAVDLVDLGVWEVFALTLQRALGRSPEPPDTGRWMAQAQGLLRGRPPHGD